MAVWWFLCFYRDMFISSTAMSDAIKVLSILPSVTNVSMMITTSRLIWAWSCQFIPFMHNVEKWPNILKIYWCEHRKKVFKVVWPFCNIMHERFKVFSFLLILGYTSLVLPQLSNTICFSVPTARNVSMMFTVSRRIWFWCCQSFHWETFKTYLTLIYRNNVLYGTPT